MIKNSHLKLMLALQGSQTLGQTAKKLHISQSALSHQLKELQQLLDGEPVVLRKNRTLRFTPVGQRILETAALVMPQLERLESDLARLLGGESGHLRIAIECHSCYQWLMPTLEQFRKQCPDVTLDFASGMHFHAMSALTASEVELVVTADPITHPEVSYVPLFDYECVLAVPKDHAAVTKGWVSPEDLQQETLIAYPVEQQKLDVYRQFLMPAGVAPKAVRNAELTMMMMQLVAVGCGVCALPNWAVEEYSEKGYVSVVRLGEHGVFATLYLAVLQSSLRRSYIQELIFLAKDIPFGTLQGIQPPGAATKVSV